MSDYAFTGYELPNIGNGATPEPGDGLGVWTARRSSAKQHRQKFEHIWKLCQAFLDGQQWTAYNRSSRQIVDLRTRTEELNREHYVVDVLSQYVRTAVGRVFSGDFRPTLAFRREDWETQAVARQAQRALDFMWDEELGADEVIYEIMLGIASYGTAALWCRFDPTKGRLLGELPIRDGQPITDPARAHEHVAALAFQGRQATIQAVHEGQLRVGRPRLGEHPAAARGAPRKQVPVADPGAARPRLPVEAPVRREGGRPR